MMGFSTHKFLRKALSFRRFFLQHTTTASKSDLNFVQANKEKEVFNFLQNEKKFEPLKQDFLTSLFIGSFQQNVIEYPSILTSFEIESLIKHASDTEKAIKNLSTSYHEPAKLLEELKKTNVFGLTISRKYGGLEYGETEKNFILENLNVDMHIANLLVQQENFCSKIIDTLGCEELKLKYLPKLASGDCIGCGAYMEESPLLDLKSFKTTSLHCPEKKYFVVNGSKMGTSNANIADLFIVFSSCHQMNNVNDADAVQYHFFVIDKNTPGVKVHKSNATNIDDNFPLYKVDFDNVIVPENHSLGNAKNTFPLFKLALGLNCLNTSVTCLAMLRNLQREALLFCESKNLKNIPVLQDSRFQTSMGYLSMYIYVVESLLYLVAGRYDKYVNQNLFLEMYAAKVTAIDFLNLGIQKYIEIVGNECYQSPSLLQKALRVLHYHTNIDVIPSNLKIIIGATGITSTIKADGDLRNKVGLRRQPHLNPSEAFMCNIFSEAKKLKKYSSALKYQGEVHKHLKAEAEILEQCFGLFRLTIEDTFTQYGNFAAKSENSANCLGDMAVNLYALIACLSRASSSYTSDMELSEHEISIIQCFASHVKFKTERLHHAAKHYTDDKLCYEYIGKHTFRNKEYPPYHPLTRSY